MIGIIVSLFVCALVTYFVAERMAYRRYKKFANTYILTSVNYDEFFIFASAYGLGIFDETGVDIRNHPEYAKLMLDIYNKWKEQTMAN